MGIRGKLFLVSAFLILVAAVSSELYLNRVLTDWIETRTERELQEDARTMREMLLDSTAPLTTDAYQEQVQRLGRAMNKRLTLIDHAGWVVADSDLEADFIPKVENHADRPEVKSALAEGYGLTRRYSNTVHAMMMKVAIPFVRNDGVSGVVRVEVALESMDRNIHRIHDFLVVGGGFGVLLSLLISGFVSHLLTRTLRRLVQHAHRVAMGVSGAVPIPPKGDEIRGLAGSFNRLAQELNQAVEMLASERNRLETVLEGMSEAVFALDGEGKIVLVNWAAAALVPHAGTLLGKRLLEAIPSETSQKLEEAMLKGTPLSKQFSMPGPEPRHVLAQVTPYVSAPGGVVVMHDITEIHRLMRLRQEFAANVSHELRTPVSILMVNAEVLKDGALDDPEAAHAMIDSIHRNAARLSGIISGLLELSRLDAGRYELTLQPLDLAEMIGHTAESMQPVLQEKGVALEMQLPEGCLVMADHDAMERVFANLLENAAKYVPEGGRVRVSAQVEERRVRIEVTDNGPGIPEEHRSRVFERFYRVDKGRARQQGGSGLGLAIVKNFVVAMGGEVGVEAAQPTGACFWVQLPRARERGSS